MFLRILIFVAVLALLQTPAQARRVALLIGQGAYFAGASDSGGLPALSNPARDVAQLAKLLGKHGFEVIACNGEIPGCFDLDGGQFLDALARLERRAVAADLALVFYAGHGLASAEGNVLAPVDAKLNCFTGAVSNGVPVERIVAATAPARHKLVILDACRANAPGEICPNLKHLSFTRIEPDALQNFLLVTSTQFGQQALDGPPGLNAPFTTALISVLEANAAVYFEQVMNEVARATYEAAQRQKGFLQIPAQVMGAGAPADCLAGKDCIGDVRMAALAVDNERLAADAAAVNSLLAVEEQAHGERYGLAERQRRVAELARTLARSRSDADLLSRHAGLPNEQDDGAAGQAALADTLDASEMEPAAEPGAMPEAKVDPDNTTWPSQRAASPEKNGSVLVRQGNLPPALDKYLASLAIAQRLAKADPANADWQRDLAVAHEKIGDALIEQGSLLAALDNFRASHSIADRLAKADPSNAERQLALAMSHEKLGDVLVNRGNLLAALENFRALHSIADRLAKSEPNNAGWQLDVAMAHEKIGDVLAQQNKLPMALARYRSSLEIVDRLAKADPDNTGGQLLLTLAQEKIGNVLVRQGDLPSALNSYRLSLAVGERLAEAEPGNADWQSDLLLSHNRIGELLHAQGNLPAALESYRASNAIAERLANGEPSNATWQRELAQSYARLALLLSRQGLNREAASAFRQGHAVLLRLRQRSPDDANLSQDLAWFEERFSQSKK